MAGIKLYLLESGNSYTHYSEFFCKEDSRPKDLNGTGHHKSTGIVSDATPQLYLYPPRSVVIGRCGTLPEECQKGCYVG